MQKGKITNKQREIFDRISQRMGWNNVQQHTLVKLFIRKGELTDMLYNEAFSFIAICRTAEQVRRWKGNDKDFVSPGQARMIERLRVEVGYSLPQLLILLRMLTGDKFEHVESYKVNAGAKLINLLEQIRSEYWKLGWIR